ncbi:MAG: 30S ribosomal protein S2 [Phycisphaeraceae bacterium]|nr:30S ribosomal protein S2 [Phycisphaeraceae bacterium]
MASLVKELVEAGIHFGQRRSNWNPRMAPYIHGVKNQIHIIDIRETIKGLLLAKKFVARTVAEGKDVCFVGTKRQARGAIEQYCTDVKMPYVTERWLGGTLTNFRTIRDRLKRLEELEGLMTSGEIKNYSKKMESQLTREQKKIFRNLNGIRSMTRLPGALVVIDVNRETNALNEARNLGIPTICLIDTDGNPELADIPIPGNDDSMRSIDIVVRELCGAVTDGRSLRSEQAVTEGQRSDGASEGSAVPPRRRSSRSQFRADGRAEASEAVEAPAAARSASPAPESIADNA